MVLNANCKARADLDYKNYTRCASIGLANMQTERLAGIASHFEGWVDFIENSWHGKNLFVNARTPDGTIKVELINYDTDKPIQGFEKENCHFLQGDLERAEVIWKDKKLSEIKSGTKLIVRFYLFNAELFSYTTQLTNEIK